jgi:hypothetical protein
VPFRLRAGLTSRLYEFAKSGFAFEDLYVMGEYADRFAKQEEDYELGTTAAEPTGPIATPPGPDHRW